MTAAGSDGRANCFDDVSIALLRPGQLTCTVVDHWIAEEAIDGPEADRIRHADVFLVGEHDDAELAVELEDDHRAEAVGSTIVPDDRAFWRLLNDPAQRIGDPLSLIATFGVCV